MLARSLEGAILRRNRKAQNLTLREVSAKSYVALGHLSKVERGEKEISSEKLGDVLKALDLPMSEFYREASQVMEQLERV